MVNAERDTNIRFPLGARRRIDICCSHKVDREALDRGQFAQTCSLLHGKDRSRASAKFLDISKPEIARGSPYRDN